MKNNRNKTYQGIIKYKERVKDPNNNLKINPDLHKPTVFLTEYDVVEDEQYQNENDSRIIKNNHSSTINHFINNKELDAKIKHKKNRIGD
ncbi:MAG: hypothetical protein ACFE9T_12195 [Promethearchaeota archaeon]